LLKRNRVAALEHARSRAGRYSRGELERALRALLVPNARGELTEYLSVFERYYQKKLRAKGGALGAGILARSCVMPQGEAGLSADDV
jgi:hypothetical protein